MKVFITHDKRGTITSIGVPAEPSAGSIGVKPEPGCTVSAFDIPGIDHPRHFSRYLREFRVDVRAGRPKLLRKATRR